MKRRVCGTTASFLLFGMLALAFNIRPASAEPATIVVPDDYPTIQEAINNANYGDTVFVRNGTYYENVVVNKTVTLVGENRSITNVDGGGTLNVVTITRDSISISGFTMQNCSLLDAGIQLNNVNHCNISRNRVTNNGWGIRLYNCSNNTISGNDITANNEYGIILAESSNNTVSGNNVKNNEYGIRLYKSSNNTVSGNKITANDRYGIRLYSASNYNIISGNNITEGLYGVSLINSSSNIILRNNISHNAEYGIGFQSYSINNAISRNNVTANYWDGIWLDGSSNCTISQNNITANSRHGIRLYSSTNNTISRNDITNNEFGILLFYSSNNSICRNNITTNNWYSHSYGLQLVRSSNNTSYHNNFVENNEQVLSDCYGNVWDDGYPSGGNFWSDYDGSDSYIGYYQNETGSDGIVDTAYVIDENNTDHYPLKKPYAGPHDIEVKIHISRTVVPEYYRTATNISLTIMNYGMQTEHVNVTCQTTTTTYEQLVMVTGRNATTMIFTWNTTGLSKGNYTITASAEPVPDETDTTDNYCRYWVIVAMIGDITGADGWPDGQCDMRDVGLVARKFSMSYPNPEYDVNCDLTGPITGVPDGIINMRDIGLVAKHFGETDP